jgi:hypothetical protein
LFYNGMMSFSYMLYGAEPQKEPEIVGFTPMPDEGVGAEGLAVVMANTGSGGVGVDEADVHQEAAEFAGACHRAVQNGQTIDQVTAACTNLSEEAKTAIYAQVCIQQCTTPEAIAEKAAAEREQAMAALQGGVGLGILASTAAPANEYGLASSQRFPFEEASRASLGALNAPALPGQERDRSVGLFA